MQLIDYKSKLESWDAQRAAGRYNPATVLVVWYKGQPVEVTIGAGQSDRLAVYLEGSLCFVLSTNYRLDYAGVEVFELAAGGEQVGEVFAQGSEQIEDYVGKRGLELSDLSLVKRFSQYLEG